MKKQAIKLKKFMVYCAMVLLVSSIALVFNTVTASSYSAGTKILHYGSTPYFITSDSGYDSVTEDMSGDQTGLQNIQFSPDGTKLYTTDYINKTVFQYTLSTTFDVTTATIFGTFGVISQESGNPTGLAFSADGTKMFMTGVISDRIFTYTLSTPFAVTSASYDGIGSTLDVSTLETSPNTILFNDDGTKLYLGGQNSTDGGGSDVMRSYTLSSPYVIAGATEDGVGERLLLNNIASANFSEDGYVFVMSSGSTIRSYNLATPYLLSSNTGVVNSTIPSPQGSPASIDFFNDGTKFIYNNNSNGIVQYSVNPQITNFSESTNDGSVSGSLKISLFSETFQDTDADNLLDIGSEVTIDNVSPGLTPVMTLSRNDTIATLTFTNQAADHQPADDVSSLEFIFDDTAFTGGDASVVTNSGDGIVYSSNSSITFDTNDSDGDGIFDEVEDNAAPGGDGNGDSVADSTQSNVASINNPVAGGHVTLETVGGCEDINSFDVVEESSLGTQDADYSYPLGLNDFVLFCDNDGESSAVTFYYNEVYDVDAFSIRKLLPSNTFGPVAGSPEFGVEDVNGTDVTTLSYSVTDGGANDNDEVENEEVHDPAGPASLNAVATAPTTTTQVIPATSNGAIGSLPVTGTSLYLLMFATFSLVLGSILFLARKRNKSLLNR